MGDYGGGLRVRQHVTMQLISVAQVTVTPQGVAPPDLDSRCEIAKLKPTNYVLAEYL
jgi:hypothetical protein